MTSPLILIVICIVPFKSIIIPNAIPTICCHYYEDMVVIPIVF